MHLILEKTSESSKALSELTVAEIRGVTAPFLDHFGRNGTVQVERSNELFKATTPLEPSKKRGISATSKLQPRYRTLYEGIPEQQRGILSEVGSKYWFQTRKDTVLKRS